MEIDRNTVKALASPTRIDILNQTLNGNNTTTDISNELDKTKSTISSHLEKLNEADLLEKDEEEGRRRVVYTPTRKAESILKGRKRKMQFSLFSGFIALVAGSGAIWHFFNPFNHSSASGAEMQSADSMNALSMEATRSTAENASKASGLPELENVFLAAGVVFFSVSIISFAYGYTMARLDR